MSSVRSTVDTPGTAGARRMRGRSQPAPEVGSNRQPRRVETDARGRVDGLPPAAEVAAGVPATARGARPRGRRAVRRQDRCARAAEACWQRGAGGLVIVTGEPGIGKTRLAARFAADVHRDGGAVLCGRADEETVWPYQPFVEALRHYVAHRRDTVSEAGVPPPAVSALASLLPELEAPGRPADAGECDRRRHQLFEAVVRLMLHAAESSGAAAHPRGPSLGRRRDDAAAAARPAPRRGIAPARGRDVRRPSAARSDPLAELRRDALDTVHLTGMSPAEAAALVTARAGRQASR